MVEGDVELGEAGDRLGEVADGAEREARGDCFCFGGADRFGGCGKYRFLQPCLLELDGAQSGGVSR